MSTDYFRIDSWDSIHRIYFYITDFSEIFQWSTDTFPTAFFRKKSDRTTLSWQQVDKNRTKNLLETENVEQLTSYFHHSSLFDIMLFSLFQM